MKTSVAERVKDALKQKSKSFIENTETVKLSEASEMYEEMVESGLTLRRGNTLISLDKVHLKQHRFNCSQ